MVGVKKAVYPFQGDRSIGTGGGGVDDRLIGSGGGGDPARREDGGESRRAGSCRARGVGSTERVGVGWSIGLGGSGCRVAEGSVSTSSLAGGFLGVAGDGATTAK